MALDHAPPTRDLTAGARADLLVIDAEAPGLLGVPDSHLLDALVFATDAPAFSQVWVAGQCRVREGRPVHHEARARQFAATMAELWAKAV